jgi:hypothetical protein
MRIPVITRRAHRDHRGAGRVLRQVTAPADAGVAQVRERPGWDFWAGRWVGDRFPLRFLGRSMGGGASGMGFLGRSMGRGAPGMGFFGRSMGRGPLPPGIFGQVDGWGSARDGIFGQADGYRSARDGIFGQVDGCESVRDGIFGQADGYWSVRDGILGQADGGPCLVGVRASRGQPWQNATMWPAGSVFAVANPHAWRAAAARDYPPCHGR